MMLQQSTYTVPKAQVHSYWCTLNKSFTESKRNWRLGINGQHYYTTNKTLNNLKPLETKYYLFASE